MLHVIKAGLSKFVRGVNKIKFNLELSKSDAAEIECVVWR